MQGTLKRTHMCSSQELEEKYLLGVKSCRDEIARKYPNIDLQWVDSDYFLNDFFPSVVPPSSEKSKDNASGSATI